MKLMKESHWVSVEDAKTSQMRRSDEASHRRAAIGSCRAYNFLEVLDFL